MKKLFNKLPDLLFFLCILFFTVGLNLQDNPPGGWYQQFIPDVNNMPISDIEFLDSLVGFAVTSGNDTNFILKTTNGGDNWFINFTDYKNFERVIFINNSVGFVCGSSFQINGAIYKTTNAGGNWFTLNTPFAQNYEDMSVLNEDTIWVVDDNGFDGGVFRTTNGGQNWTQQYSSSSLTPENIYMCNGSIGFFSGGGVKLYKTTNSGLNWDTISNENGFSNMYFLDSLTGWKSRGNIKKTTNGGESWTTQILPFGGMIFVSTMREFLTLNKDTLWGVGGAIRFGPGNNRGIIWKTTNGGINWGYQLPDTNIHIVWYFYSDFVNKLNGWAYHPNTGVHTVTGGGDTTYYTGINQLSNEIPKGFTLHQNYPNPFNPTTKIRFELSKASIVRLTVYDVLGKEITTLVSEKLSSGSYEVDWNATGYTSGVYFYRLETKDFSETKKMLLVK